MRTKRFLRILVSFLLLMAILLCSMACDINGNNNTKTIQTKTDKTENSSYSSNETQIKETAFEDLVNYILQNGEFNYTNGQTRLRLHEGYTNSSQEEFTVVTIDYNPVSKEVILTLYVSLATIENRPFSFMSIGLTKTVGSYRYAMEVDHGDDTTCYIDGYINSKTFTRNTLPEYDTYQGAPSDLIATQNFANVMATELLDYLDRLVSYRLNLSMEDFGFIAYN